ncbi:2537_t:CDS:2, partial [Diversispora eburnea]
MIERNDISIASFTPPARYSHSSILINSKLYILGGKNSSIENNELILNDIFYLDLSSSFDTDNPTWESIKSIENISSSLKSFWCAERFQFIDDGNGKLYIFGSNINAPKARYDAATVLLNDGKILFIGGREFNAGGDKVISRSGHTAVLGSNGLVVIFGGTMSSFALTPNSPLVLLNTSTTPFIYSVSHNPIPSGATVTHHTSTIYQNYMLVIFDLNTFNWSTYVNIQSNSETRTRRFIISVSIIGAIITIGFSLIGLIYYKKQKKKNAKIMLKYEEKIDNNDNSDNCSNYSNYSIHKYNSAQYGKKVYSIHESSFINLDNGSEYGDDESRYSIPIAKIVV